jgi:CBS domain containing-hemolysin-like protein
MILIVILFTAGLALSAFFSGTETGFYRATRVRLLIEALSGNWRARGLLWATNHPSLFVSTTLVGNNLANYLVSLAVVLCAQRLGGGGHPGMELVATLALAPVVFIYGELLPKNLFFDAPNRLLLRFSPGFLVAAIIFAPVTLVLWLLNRVLQAIVRRSPQEIRLVLARRELADLLEEGHEAGLLHPSQQALVQGTFSLAGQPIRQFATPAGRFSRVTDSTSKEDILQLARKQRRSLIPVEESRGKRRLLGYVRVCDLALDPSDELPPLRPVVTLHERETYLLALVKLLAADSALGHVVADQGKTVGLVSVDQLTKTLSDDQES